MKQINQELDEQRRAEKRAVEAQKNKALRYSLC
jgi:hypothetical protein